MSRHVKNSPRRWPVPATILMLTALCGGLPFAFRATGQPPDKSAASPDSVERDYKQELPRIPPREPGEAAAVFHVAPGFHVEQVAAEPLVVDPVAMAFDEYGRLYVVEMRDYSEDDQAYLGRVRRLTDTDGDGHFDDSVIFADQLSWPTAVVCYDGGIFVGAAPDLFYLKDTDGDGQADEKRIVYTGFGRSNVQGLVNSFHWGLDNRIHGATSSSGATLVRPDRPDDPPLVLRGRDFAFDPRTLEITATSGGAQHGMSFDAWGDKFVCSNSDHLQLVMFEDRYAARNPYCSPPASRQSIAADGPQADVFRTSPVEPWRVLRTRLRVKGIVPGPVEGGGRAAGYFTGATGVTLYTGDNWPAESQGVAIVGDVGSNLVHRKQLVPQGIGYQAVRIDEKSELLTSEDIWFRPVQFANAPDGTLFILDMYREVIEHPASLHPVIKQHLDLTSGRDRGRLYRLVAHGTTPRPAPKLSQQPIEQLVKLLEHPNGWHRAAAARRIYEGQDGFLTAALEDLSRHSALAQGRIHALYALDGLNTLTARVVTTALDDADPRVRRHAVLLAEQFLATDPTLRTRLPQLADDRDERVRYQVAFSLGEMSGPARDQALTQIVLRDGMNSYFRFAVHSSLESGAGNVLALLYQNRDAQKSEAGREMLRALAAQIGRQQRSDDVTAVLRLLREENEENQQKQQQDLIAALAPKADSALARQIAAATGGSGSQILAGLLAEARETAVNLDLPVEQRVEAIHRLQLSRFADEQQRLAQLLTPDQPLEVQEAGLRTLAGFDAPEVAGVVVSAWATLSPRLRLKAGDVLFSRPVWIKSLLDAVEQKQIQAADIPSGQWKWLATHPDPQLSRRGQALAPAIDRNCCAAIRRH
jgi:putative membrane-bound dehydrogenase-like protein